MCRIVRPWSSFIVSWDIDKTFSICSAMVGLGVKVLLWSRDWVGVWLWLVLDDGVVFVVWCLWCVERALGRSWFGHRFVTYIIIGMEYGFGDTQVY